MPRVLIVLVPAAVCAAISALCGSHDLPAAAQPPAQEYRPKVSPASNEGLKAIARIRVPKGLKVDLWAAEPLLANPVAFCFDEQGRCYVAETFRLHAGVTDNRGHMYWLDDELASRTVADRVAMYKKHLRGKFDSYAREHDRVRLIEDTTGDGKADRATVFADGFKNHADGIGSGVLARGGNVWYTCIPNLWLLRDTTGDGKADVKKSLHHGYGVHVAFIGHDLHGLKMGPDGKLYFSIGDRGLHVETEGRTFAVPDTGSVLRCNPDGSELEIVATGLRNPQELAFDEFGNLFTGDNNADSGDQARWVYVVEGGDSGWRIGYQYLKGPMAQLGPWNAEKLWHKGHPGQAAYIVPPIDYVASGPSGLTYHPGVTQIPERYRNHFFLCDFRGGPGGSGVNTFTARPKGASFELGKRESFVGSLLATDCDFGPDGAFYVSDWVDGWGLTGKGRIYKVADPTRAANKDVAEVKKLLSDGMAKRDVKELTFLLAHADMRVRQEAQFALVERGPTSIEVLEGVAAKAKDRLARVHAIWGLGQLTRQKAAAVFALQPLLKDADAEVRAQAAKSLAGDRDPKGTHSPKLLLPLLTDSEPRVRFFAAMTLGKMGAREAVGPVLQMLRENDDRDAYLRHAGVMALTGINDRAALEKAAADKSPAARRGALLAMRRLEMPEVARFLSDSEPSLAVEAARAIYDVPIPAALPQLAALATKTGLEAPLLHRVMAANFRLGKSENAEALASLAARGDVPVALRVEAVRMLADWAKPSGRDRVVGLWRPLEPRPGTDAATALRAVLVPLLTSPEKVSAEAVKAVTKLGLRDVGPSLTAVVLDAKQPPRVRAATLLALETLKDQTLSDTTRAALLDDDPHVRAAGRRVFARQDPARAASLLAPAVLRGQTVERQEALTALGELKRPEADQLLTGWLDRLLAGDVPAEVRLDLLEAAGKRGATPVLDRLRRYEASRPKGDPVAAHRESLAGGDPEAGRRIFFEKAEVSCVRCHKVGEQGGDVGPDLKGIGGKQTREYLLESIVVPNKQIAKGFETVVLTLADGRIETGILRSDDGKVVQLMTAEGKLVTVPRDDIAGRSAGASAMPDDAVRHLSRRELRDLVEFLATLK